MNFTLRKSNLSHQSVSPIRVVLPSPLAVLLVMTVAESFLGFEAREERPRWSLMEIIRIQPSNVLLPHPHHRLP